MTFDYTQTRLVVALPDLEINGPTGRIDGCLPVLLRLDWSSVETIHRFAQQAASRYILHDIIATRANDPRHPGPDKSSKVLPNHDAPFANPEAAERWRDGRRRPTNADIQDLLDRLRVNTFLDWFTVEDDLLRTFLDTLAERAAQRQDMTDVVLEMGGSYPKYVWDERGRLRLIMTDFKNPYDRARFEAMAAYSDGGPGLTQCDVCARWFVPVRAGRPSRRCPGFECTNEAQQRYQRSPERREYRRLSMRLNRAKNAGDAASIKEAESALAAFKRRGESS